MIEILINLGFLYASHDGKATFTDGTVTANFGDVTDTNLRTVTFEAIIASDQSGKTIENIATVSADNVTEPNRPKEEIVVEQEDIVAPPAGKVEPPVKDEQVVVKTPSTNKTEGGKPLPKTATDIFNYMLVGMLILLVGLVVLRRRKSSVK